MSLPARIFVAYDVLVGMNRPVLFLLGRNLHQMSSKQKKVTYQPPIDENSDYLVPLQYHAPIKLPLKPSKDSPTPPPAPVGFLASIFLPVSLILYVGIAIVQLIIGLIYIGQCSVQELIVVWMIVSGIFGIALTVIGILINVQMQRQPPTSKAGFGSYPIAVRILLPIFVLILLFVVTWFFIGQVFVFEVKLRVEFFDPALPEYCHGNLYKAAYILIFIDYLIFLLAIILNVLSCVAPPEETKRPNPKKKKPMHAISV